MWNVDLCFKQVQEMGGQLSPEKSRRPNFWICEQESKTVCSTFWVSHVHECKQKNLPPVTRLNAATKFFTRDIVLYQASKTER